jgi:hypothetical protein
VNGIIADFSRATHLLVKNAGHEDMLPDNGVQQLIRKFFVSGAVDTTEISLPVPQFIPIF